MAVPRMTDSELLFSVAGVARMVNVPKEAVRDAIRHKRLRAETILIRDRIGISIPLSAVAEFWNLPRDRVRTIKAEAGQGAPNAPVSVLTPIISRGRALGKHSRRQGPPLEHRKLDSGVEGRLQPLGPR